MSGPATSRRTGLPDNESWLMTMLVNHGPEPDLMALLIELYALGCPLTDEEEATCWHLLDIQPCRLAPRQRHWCRAMEQKYLHAEMPSDQTASEGMFLTGH